jgi:NADPH2:quinone reductase
MRGFLLERHDGPDGLRMAELDEPRPGAGEVLIGVEAIGVNFPDLLATRGAYQHAPPLPFVPGCEIAGVVREAGSGSAWAVGDRVAAFVWDGGFAEVVVAPDRAIMRVPDEVPSTVASAMVVNYQTALFALDRRGGVRAGETVLVLGAGGGIGTAAAQVARGLGAQVLAGVADEGQAEVATRAGTPRADVLVLELGFAVDVRERTAGRGVDVVLDPLGDWLFDEAVRALAPEGRILVVGFAAGEIPTIKVNRLLLRNASAVGVAWGAFLELDPTITAAAGERLTAMLRAGHVRPVVGATYGFDELPAALARLAEGTMPGKGVVEVAEG